VWFCNGLRGVDLNSSVIRNSRKEVCIVRGTRQRAKICRYTDGRVFFAPFRASIKAVENTFMYLSKGGSDFTIQEHTCNKPNSALNYPAQICRRILYDQLSLRKSHFPRIVIEILNCTIGRISKKETF
jgi:hypothetical protein